MRSGRVTVNGELAVEPGFSINPDRDRVEVDGRRVRPPSEHTYILLNKPVNVVTTASDPQGRPTVLDVVKSRRRVFPVGRLDYDSSGLLLLTDDGELAQRLAHPRYRIEKTYLTDVRGELTTAKIEALRHGVTLKDGITAPAKVKVVRRSRTGATLELTLREGRNREVRRMCAALGLKVANLHRTQLGPLRIHGVRPGEFRPLTSQEIKDLRACVA